MKEIVFSSDHRRKHFDFFRRMDQPHFSITATADITGLPAFARRTQLAFTPLMVYCLAKTANDIPEFRQRIRGDILIEHEQVHPSFAVWTEAADVFSFCDTPYDPDMRAFVTEALARMAYRRKHPSFENEPGRDDYLFLSALPWVAFTGIQHAMHYSPPDSVPRISWGKYVEDRGRLLLPLSVQAHHAVVDGRHMGAYFERVQDFFSSFR